MITNSRGSTSNNDGFFHDIYSKFKKAILSLTITDCIQKEGLIYLSYNTKFFLRLHNLPMKEMYHLPSEIADSNFYELFDMEEKELINTFCAFNVGVEFKQRPKKVSKVVFGEKIFVMIQDITNPLNTLSFEFDEKKFTGLIKKYRTSTEIRKIIKGLLTYE